MRTKEAVSRELIAINADIRKLLGKDEASASDEAALADFDAKADALKSELASIQLHESVAENVAKTDAALASEQPAADPRAEFKAMVAEFGQAKAAEYFGAGISLAEAKEKHYAELKASNAELEKKVAELSKTQAPDACAQKLPGVERNDDDASAKAKELQSKHGLSDGQAEFLAGTPIVGAPKQ